MHIHKFMEITFILQHGADILLLLLANGKSKSNSSNMSDFSNKIQAQS